MISGQTWSTKFLLVEGLLHADDADDFAERKSRKISRRFSVSGEAQLSRIGRPPAKKIKSQITADDVPREPRQFSRAQYAGASHFHAPALKND